MAYQPIPNPLPATLPVSLTENTLDYRLMLILTELRVITSMLQIGLNVRDEPNDIRKDLLSTIQ